MRILGVDPGTHKTGYGVIDLAANRVTHIAHGVITTSARAPLADRLAQIYRGLVEVIGAHDPQSAGVETVFQARNAQSALKLGHARGVILLGVSLAGLALEEYTPMQVKSAVVGYGHATKEQVQEMIKRLLALPKAPPSDAADALAVAICHGRSAATNERLAQALASRRR